MSLANSCERAAGLYWFWTRLHSVNSLLHFFFYCSPWRRSRNWGKHVYLITALNVGCWIDGLLATKNNLFIYKVGVKVLLIFVLGWSIYPRRRKRKPAKCWLTRLHWNRPPFLRISVAYLLSKASFLVAKHLTTHCLTSVGLPYP